MTEEQKVEQMEAKGRDLFKAYCEKQHWCKIIKESKDRFSHWDMAIMSGGTQMIAEIKYREYSSDAFKTWFLERKKLEELKNIQKKCQTPSKIVYINIFTDDFIAIWDLDNLHYSTCEFRALAATQYANTTKVDKNIYNLLMIDAIDRNYLNSIFNIEENEEENNEEDNLPF